MAIARAATESLLSRRAFKQPMSNTNNFYRKFKRLQWDSYIPARLQQTRESSWMSAIVTGVISAVPTSTRLRRQNIYLYIEPGSSYTIPYRTRYLFLIGWTKVRLGVRIYYHMVNTELVTRHRSKRIHTLSQNWFRLTLELDDVVDFNK